MYCEKNDSDFHKNTDKDHCIKILPVEMQKIANNLFVSSFHWKELLKNCKISPRSALEVDSGGWNNAVKGGKNTAAFQKNGCAFLKNCGERLIGLIRTLLILENNHFIACRTIIEVATSMLYTANWGEAVDVVLQENIKTATQLEIQESYDYMHGELSKMKEKASQCLHFSIYYTTRSIHIEQQTARCINVMKLLMALEKHIENQENLSRVESIGLDQKKNENTSPVAEKVKKDLKK